MTEIRFYRLMTRPLDTALPGLVQKALAGGKRIIIRAPDDKEVERLNGILWTFSPDSFIPHGSKKDGHAAQQPVWLSCGDDNPNNADMLILTGGLVAGSLDGFTLVCDMFDGRSEDNAIAARQRWAGYKSAGHDLTYWQQTDTGWERKA